MSKFKRCPICRTEILKILKHCPHCGAEQPNPFMKYLFAIVFIFVLSAGIIAINYLN